MKGENEPKAMTMTLARAGVLAVALAMAGCNGTLEDIAPKAERELPTEIVNTMKAKGMSPSSPIMLRIFKEEGVLEVWKQKDNGRYDIVTSYEICKWSGKLGPKFVEGDRQAPEGFYTVRPGQMNPKSSYHLAFNIGYPNTYDRANGRTGKHLMVHGACSSAGCYSMEDEQVEQIYAFAREAFEGGQTAFQVQAYPFRMTPENMARYRGDPNYPFWQALKEGHDHFDITKVPPKVDVCERGYVFNRLAEDGHAFAATEACPPWSRPQALQTAYDRYQARYDKAFQEALAQERENEPTPTIAGLEESRLVADWSRRRARGERVSPEPPSLKPVAVASASAKTSDGDTEPASTVTAYAAGETSRPESEEAGALRPAEGNDSRQAAEDVPRPTQNPTTASTTGEAESSPETAKKSRLARLWNLFAD